VSSTIAQTEADLQAAVMELARRCGWRVAHFRPARTDGGWRTAVSGEGAGFPDLVMVRGKSLLIVELKSATGRLSAAQGEWVLALGAAGADMRVWSPDDWPEIETTLKVRR